MLLANGTGKSNILRLVEFFLTHGTGSNVKLHWENGDSVWEPHKQCLASLSFALTQVEQDVFSKWRVVAIVSLLLREPHIKQLIADLEEQDLVSDRCTFSNVEVHPEEVGNEFDIEDCPLFRKLRPHRRSVPRKVELFWEMIESALLELYTKNKPYDHAIYYAHTESRDTANVVFQQILCTKKDRKDILKQLESVYVCHNAKFVFPSVWTLEKEVAALRSVLTGAVDVSGPEEDLSADTASPPFMMKYRGILLAPGLDSSVWERVAGHVRYGLPLEEASFPSGDSLGPTSEESSTPVRHANSYPSFTAAVKPSLPSPCAYSGLSARDRVEKEGNEARDSPGRVCEESAPSSYSGPTSATRQPTGPCKSANGGYVSLVNCGFTSAIRPGETPPILSLSDVKSWCSQLLLRTERYMVNRPPGCQMIHVKGIHTSFLRHVDRISSVCVK